MHIDQLTPEALERCAQRYENYGARHASATAQKLWGARVVPLMAPAVAKGRYAGAPLGSPTRSCVGYMEYAAASSSLPYFNPDAIENILCLDGSLEVSWGTALERSATLARFDMVSMPSGVLHTVRNPSAATSRAIVVLNAGPTSEYPVVFADGASATGIDEDEASRLGVVLDGRGREAQDGEVEERITRFETLVPYKRQLNSNTGIPPEATEWLTAGSVYPLSVPEGHVGRSQYAPVRGLPGLSLAIAECEPGDGPLPHAHFDTQESFFVLDGQWDVTSGFRDELSLAVKPYDLVAMPDKVMRAFKNTGTEKARLFVIIQGRQKMSDLIAYTPEAGAEIERRHGAATVEAFGRINITFDAGLV
jgi:uncharacterized RmlC-like cupin family protein